MPRPLPLPDALSFAGRLADAARAETLARFRKPIEVENKAGLGPFDPVTIADQAAEAAMRALIAAAYPEHGIIGEESPETIGQSPYAWVLDPIDGTRAYICGLPSWGTLIALTEHGRPILGLIDLPGVGQRYRGWPGGADLHDASGRHELRTRQATRLSQAALATTDPGLFSAQEAEAFASVRARALLCRYGLDCSGYAALAAGGLDLVIESGLRVWDIAAIIPVITGAGGLVTSWSGGPAERGGQAIAAANRALLDEALVLLAPAAQKA